MTSQYLPPVSGGRWAISRTIRGRTIALIQNTPVDDERDIKEVLYALDISPTSVSASFRFDDGHSRNGSVADRRHSSFSNYSRLSEGREKEERSAVSKTVGPQGPTVSSNPHAIHTLAYPLGQDLRDNGGKETLAQSTHNALENHCN
jgi:hypothetical protein